MEPHIVPPETASLVDEDIISDGDEDNSKDKINSSKFDNRTPKCVNNGKRLFNGDAIVFQMPRILHVLFLSH